LKEKSEEKKRIDIMKKEISDLKQKFQTLERNQQVN
jgi:hypothetical protein